MVQIVSAARAEAVVGESGMVAKIRSGAAVTLDSARSMAMRRQYHDELQAAKPSSHNLLLHAERHRICVPMKKPSEAEH